MPAARQGAAIRRGDVIERIIARRNLERRVLQLVWMSPPERAGPSGQNAHTPPFCRRIDSSNVEKPERPVWPPRRLRMEFDEGDYEHEEVAKPEPPSQRKKVKRRVNPLIDAEAGVDGDASCNEGTNDENYNLDGFIVADDDDF